MSEYGGIIGGAVGAVVGFYFGGPTGASWGWSIGASLGGAYSASKQVIPGPKIGDSQKQWATEGAPIPIVFGYSPPIQGTVVADMREPLIVTKRERQGKGGPKVESESAYRTYAIMFCEGQTTLRQAWKNGRLVYDATNPAMAADNAAFLEYATWLSGSYDQMPHPALEEIYGVGNAPAFRGRSVLVLDKEDVTDMRGGRNQWHVRVFRGAAKSYTTPPYPIIFFDSLNVTSETLRGVQWEQPLDELNIGALTVGGSLREVLQTYSIAPEPVDIFAITFAGELEDEPDPLKQYGYGTESLDIGATTTGGSIELTLLRYENYLPESFDIGGITTGGSLT